MRLRRSLRNVAHAFFLCAVMSFAIEPGSASGQNPPSDCSTANYSCFGKNLEFGSCTNYDCDQMGAWCYGTLCNQHMPQYWDCQPNVGDNPNKPSAGECKCLNPCVS